MGIINCSWYIGNNINAIGNDIGGIGPQASLVAPGYGTDETDPTNFYSKLHSVYDQGHPDAWDFTSPIWYEWPDRDPLFTPGPVVVGKPGYLTGIYLHATPGQYVRIYNPTGVNRRISVDGVYWGGASHTLAYQNSGLVGAGGYLEIKPASDGIILHNIYFEEQIAIKLVNGVGDELEFMQAVGV